MIAQAGTIRGQWLGNLGIVKWKAKKADGPEMSTSSILSRRFPLPNYIPNNSNTRWPSGVLLITAVPEHKWGTGSESTGGHHKKGGKRQYIIGHRLLSPLALVHSTEYSPLAVVGYRASAQRRTQRRTLTIEGKTPSCAVASGDKLFHCTNPPLN